MVDINTKVKKDIFYKWLMVINNIFYLFEYYKLCLLEKTGFFLFI